MRIQVNKRLVIFAGIILAAGWYVHTQFKNDRSFLFQLKEIFFPTKYSQGQAQTFQTDLSYMAKQAHHEHLGWDYAKAGHYDQAVAEYQKAIEIAQQDPRDWAKINNQKFSRGSLMEVYEKAGRYQEAIEQADWMLVHKPSEPYRLELLAWKKVYEAEKEGQYGQALAAVNEFLKSSEELNEYRRTKDRKGWAQPDSTLQEFRAKRQEIQHKLT